MTGYVVEYSITEETLVALYINFPFKTGTFFNHYTISQCEK